MDPIEEQFHSPVAVIPHLLRWYMREYQLSKDDAVKRLKADVSQAKAEIFVSRFPGFTP